MSVQRILIANSLPHGIVAPTFSRPGSPCFTGYRTATGSCGALPYRRIPNTASGKLAWRMSLAGRKSASRPRTVALSKAPGNYNIHSTPVRRHHAIARMEWVGLRRREGLSPSNRLALSSDFFFTTTVTPTRCRRRRSGTDNWPKSTEN